MPIDRHSRTIGRYRVTGDLTVDFLGTCDGAELERWEQNAGLALLRAQHVDEDTITWVRKSMGLGKASLREMVVETLETPE